MKTGLIVYTFLSIELECRLKTYLTYFFNLFVKPGKYAEFLVVACELL